MTSSAALAAAWMDTQSRGGLYLDATAVVRGTSREATTITREHNPGQSALIRPAHVVEHFVLVGLVVLIG